MSQRSVQDPSYQAEYEAFCQKREQAQLPYVSYRNFLLFATVAEVGQSTW